MTNCKFTAVSEMSQTNTAVLCRHSCRPQMGWETSRHTEVRNKTFARTFSCSDLLMLYKVLPHFILFKTRVGMRRDYLFVLVIMTFFSRQ